MLQRISLALTFSTACSERGRAQLGSLVHIGNHVTLVQGTITRQVPGSPLTLDHLPNQVQAHETERDTCLACISEFLSLPVKSNLGYIPNNITIYFFEMCIWLRYYVRATRNAFCNFIILCSHLPPPPNVSPFLQNQLSQQTLLSSNIITLSVMTSTFFFKYQCSKRQERLIICFFFSPLSRLLQGSPSFH